MFHVFQFRNGSSDLPQLLILDMFAEFLAFDSLLEEEQSQFGDALVFDFLKLRKLGQGIYLDVALNHNLVVRTESLRSASKSCPQSEPFQQGVCPECSPASKLLIQT